MRTEDECNKTMAANDLECEHVKKFFKDTGDNGYIQIDMGYNCRVSVTVNGLYEMFTLREKMEKEGHTF